MRSEEVKALARECGFELAGVAAAAPLPEADFYRDWVRGGMAGEMRYLTDHGPKCAPTRAAAALGRDRSCASANSINVPSRTRPKFTAPERAWISRYAWGEDYHEVLRRGLKRWPASRTRAASRSNARSASIPRRCLKGLRPPRGARMDRQEYLPDQEDAGSWFFSGELLLSLALDARRPPPDRCGTCPAASMPARRCAGSDRRRPAWALDSRRCISYFTIELRGAVPEPAHADMGSQIFGCDICQDVCPWNRGAPVTTDKAFAAVHFAPPLDRLAALSELEFRAMFRGTPVLRARYTGSSAMWPSP